MKIQLIPGRAANLATVNSVLVKFQVNDKSLIPAGIRQQVRKDDHDMNRQHADDKYDCGNTDLSAVGRVRPGMVDTGDNFIPHLNNVQPNFLITALTNSGFVLAQCHWYPKQNKGYKKGEVYVIVLDYKKQSVLSKITSDDAGLKVNVSEGIKLEGETLAQRRELSRTTWSQLFAWSNPNKVITLNFSGHLKDVRPRNALVIRKGTLSAATINVDSTVTEEDEVEKEEQPVAA